MSANLQQNPVSSRPSSASPPIARRRRRGDARVAAGFLAPTLSGFTIFTLFPILASIAVAFTIWPLAGTAEFIGLGNFIKLFTDDPAFWVAVVNTLVFVVGYVSLNLVISLALAAWISPRMRGGSIYRVLIFIPVVTPAVANAAVWQLMLVPNGVIDGVWQSVFGIHAPNFLGSTETSMMAVVALSLWQGIGYNLLIFTAALQSVPDDLMSAAAIDGAGTGRKFFNIKVPLISPWIFFAAVMTLITSFQVFAQPFVLTAGGPESSTVTMVVYLYRMGFQYFNLGYASAIGVLLLIMILIATGITFLIQKKWVHYDS